MGFSPHEVQRMSVWQYLAILEGYSAAHDPDGEKRLSSAEVDALWEFVNG